MTPRRSAAHLVSRPRPRVGPVWAQRVPRRYPGCAQPGPPTPTGPPAPPRSPRTSRGSEEGHRCCNTRTARAPRPSWAGTPPWLPRRARRASTAHPAFVHASTSVPPHPASAKPPSPASTTPPEHPAAIATRIIAISFFTQVSLRAPSMGRVLRRRPPHHAGSHHSLSAPSGPLGQTGPTLRDAARLAVLAAISP
jgi:hypothetical protein